MVLPKPHLALFVVVVALVFSQSGCLYASRAFACDDDSGCLADQRCVDAACADRADAHARARDRVHADVDLVGEGEGEGAVVDAAGEGEGEGEGGADVVVAGEGEGEGEGEGANDVAAVGEGEGVGEGVGEGEGEGEGGEGEGVVAVDPCAPTFFDTFDDANASARAPFTIVDVPQKAEASVADGLLRIDFDGTQPKSATATATLDVRNIAVVVAVAEAPSATNIELVVGAIRNPGDHSDDAVVRVFNHKLEIVVHNNGVQIAFLQTSFDDATDRFTRVTFDAAADALVLATSTDGVAFSERLRAPNVARDYWASAELSFGGGNTLFSADSVAIDSVELLPASCP